MEMEMIENAEKTLNKDSVLHTHTEREVVVCVIHLLCSKCSGVCTTLYKVQSKCCWGCCVCAVKRTSVPLKSGA